MNKKESMYKKITEHGSKLNTVFSLTGDPVKLYKRLHRLELAIDTYQEKSLIPRLAKIIGAENMDKIYVNHDPRGYTLKLTETESLKHTSLFKDWGGYGILAPDFSE